VSIYSIQIKNFKSIRDSGELPIRNINVLIGSNGVGKSNFISFFKFINRLINRQLQIYINQNGRADKFLYFGRKKSEFLGGKIIFRNKDEKISNFYEFRMIPDQDGNLIFDREWSAYNMKAKDLSTDTISWDNKLKNDLGTFESQIPLSNKTRDEILLDFFSSLKIFHFHDTSFNSRVKQPSSIKDYAYLNEDGDNIAAFLYRLQEANSSHFRAIEKVIQSIAPFFNRFYLQPDEINPEQIYLRWFEIGSDQIFNAHNFSDGTLRMICLTTLLLQPSPPKTIIIDEPELGLHPFAISKLAAMLQSASDKSQIIVSTQSVNLVNEFNAEDIIVVDRKDNQSTFTRLSEERLNVWLTEDYSIGELWEKNVLGGRP